MAITAFLSRSPGLLNRGPGGPASLGHVPQSSIFSPTHLIPNWLNFLCTSLYNSLTPPSFLWASQITLIQPVHGQGYILIFLDRMHLLFTQVHFLFWQPGRVGGQYTFHLYFLAIVPLLMLMLFLVSLIRFSMLFFMKSSKRIFEVSMISSMLTSPLPPSFIDTYSL